MESDSIFDRKQPKEAPELKMERIGSGGTCDFFKLRIHGKLHFVKEIKEEYKSDPRMRNAFIKENEIGYRLNHPGLVTYVYVDGILNPAEYVVTEWVDGHTLHKFLENHPDYFHRKDNLDKFIRELSEVLTYLHINGVIHGDIKPANIMLSLRGSHVKLLDLGFASTDSHTLTSGFTPEFAAPERENSGPSESSDYYSLGKLLDYIEESNGKKLPKR